MSALATRYREADPCPPGTCRLEQMSGNLSACRSGKWSHCLGAHLIAGRWVEDVSTFKLWESLGPAPGEPGDDIEPALGERWFCGGCGTEHWEHDEDDDWSCCDWRPWED